MVGICTALSLAERGVTVTLIDRGDPGQETSYGNAGVISPWSLIPQSLPGLWYQIPKLMFGAARPLSIRPSALAKMVPWGLKFLANGTPRRVRAASDAMEVLCSPSIDLYRRHLEGTGEAGLIIDAMYVHAFRDAQKASLDSIDYAIRCEKGGDLERIGANQLRTIEPNVDRSFQAAILIKGQARAASPGRLGTVLADKARALGVLFERREIVSLNRAPSGWRIQCDGKVIEADKVVLSAGAWSPGLLEPLGYKVPLVAERGYHVEFPNPGVALSNSLMDADAKCVASTMEGGLRFAGQAEFAPVDAPMDRKKKDLLIRLAKSAIPKLNTAAPRFWMGRRPSFPDSLPAIGQIGDEPGLFANFGHSHYGLMMAPKSGEILADLLTGTRPNMDLTAYSPDRF